MVNSDDSRSGTDDIEARDIVRASGVRERPVLQEKNINTCSKENGKVPNKKKCIRRAIVEIENLEAHLYALKTDSLLRSQQFKLECNRAMHAIASYNFESELKNCIDSESDIKNINLGIESESGCTSTDASFLKNEIKELHSKIQSLESTHKERKKVFLKRFGFNGLKKFAKCLHTTKCFETQK